MKVKTCASNFRSTVQQLTGRDSDLVDRLMDVYADNNNNSYNNIVDVTNDVFMFDVGDSDSKRVVEIPELTASNTSYESPTSSGSGSMAFEESGVVGGGMMFSDVIVGHGGGGGFDGGFSFDEIFDAAGFLLECPLDESNV